ncbi:MAG: hypothetical protein MI741_04365, partial [Rhodospirillales bacterium]|nr:hypothetical protein [Rhodospirillales bacterium]
MIRRDDNLREVKQLTELACEGQLSPQQARQLDELVCSDDQVAWYFTRYMAMHAMLERYELHSLQGTHEQQEDESAGPMPPDEITLADLAALDAPDEALKLVDVTAQLQLEEAVRRAKEAERAAAYARQARRLGLVKDDTKTRSRIIIPTPVFYGGIAALLAVGLWVGWIAVSSMIGEEPKDFSETTPQPSEPEQAVVVERPVVATLIRTLDAVWA